MFESQLLQPFANTNASLVCMEVFSNPIEGIQLVVQGRETSLRLLSPRGRSEHHSEP
jgi:hypothetical protein